MKKLSLHKETIRNLQENRLEDIRGGGTNSCTAVSCLSGADCYRRCKQDFEN